MKIPLDWLKEYVHLDNLSPQEIGDAFTQIGLMTDKPFDGKVFDLEHRFDRSDWLSILGCARDLAAYLKVDLKLPPTYTEEGKKPQANQIVNIKVECPGVVNRFNTRVFRNIKVQASPTWLKNRLEAYGVPSINNIVDITNYVMVELGQPMHAQDLARFREREIVIRKAHNEEKLCTFLGNEVTLYPEAFVLTQNGVATVLGGIVGGKETGVNEKTTDIILDAGNYNQNVIRKVSRKLKIQNETVLRYDKFLHPDLTQYAIERATYLILELAGGQYYQNIDWNPKESKPKEMILRRSRVSKLAGFDVPNETIADILTRLEYQIVNADVESFKLVVPYFRTDIEVEDDIVSDILRINGYAKIPTAQIQNAPPKDITPEIYIFEETLRDAMVQLGAHEFITDPLVCLSDRQVSHNGNLAGNQIVLENSQNSQKSALRTSITDTLKEIIPNYTKNQINSGVLFEVGKIYSQKGDKKDYQTYTETRVLGCVVFDKGKSPKELHKITSSLLSTLLKNMGINDFSLKKLSGGAEATIYVGDRELGSCTYNSCTLYIQQLYAEQRHVDRILSDVQIPNFVETSFLVPKGFPVGGLMDVIKSTSSDVLKTNFLKKYGGKELGDNKESVSIETIFKPCITREDGMGTINTALAELKKLADISIRS